MGGQAGFTLGEDFLVEGVTVGIHGHDGGEVLHFKLPNRLWGAELLQKGDAADTFDALCQDLGRAADGVEVDTTVFTTCREGAIAHAPFTDNAPEPEVADDFPLIRFFADGGGRPGSDDLPAVLLVFDHD